MNIGWYLLAICICRDEPLSLEGAEKLYYENKPWLKANGRKGKTGPPYDIDFNKKLIDAKKAGLTYREIGEKYKLDKSAVKGRIERYRRNFGYETVNA